VNILFVNYGDFATNSLNHIGAFANSLSRDGHSCIVAVPRNRESIKILDNPLFIPYLYEEVLATPNHFPDSKAASIIHAWTPRENVRLFVEAYQRSHTVPVILHLEDNETYLLESYYRKTLEQLQNDKSITYNPAWTKDLCHPALFKPFISLSDGITIITEALQELTPSRIPTLTISPPLDFEHFHPLDSSSISRLEIGIKDNDKVVVYHGGNTSANREDIRTLYLAIQLLNDRGSSTKLVRTGFNDPDFIKSFGFDLTKHVIDLGYVDHDLLPHYLALSDVFVQPGSDDAFNRFRLPSKVPEFLAMKKPVILPQANIGLKLTDGENAFLLQKGTPEEIADACQRLFDDPSLSRKIAENGATFARENFDTRKNTASLLSFYQEIAETKRASTIWRTLHETDLSQKDLLPILTSLLTAQINSGKEDKTELLWELKNCLQESFAEVNDVSRLLDQSIQEKQKHEMTIAALKNDQLKLEAKLAQTEGKAALSREKVSRLQNTFSWKMTSPLRSLRRLVSDPFTKKKSEPPPLNKDSDQVTSTANLDQSQETRNGSADNVSIEYDQRWIDENQNLSQETRDHLRSKIDNLSQSPLISVLLPVYNTNERWLRLAIKSVTNQIYTHWELCISDDASTEPHIKTVLKDAALNDDRIKVSFRETNGHISAASNTALEMVTGEFIALLDHDDELSEDALAEVAFLINENPEADLIYSDEDKVDEENRHFQPYFKPDWNPDLFLSQNMISHLGVFRTSLARKVGGFKKGYEGSQDWDLALRISEHTCHENIKHIPKVIYHWRAIEGSTAYATEEKEYAHQSASRALNDHFKRIGEQVELYPVPGNHWKVYYKLSTMPLVSVIIPTRNQRDLLEPCLNSVLQKTTYPNLEVIVADNDSDDPSTQNFLQNIQKKGVKVIQIGGSFNFSRIINQSAQKASGDFLCFLNNDITVINENWLEEMLTHAQRAEIGAVGAMLYYPNDTIQHAGVILGMGGIAGHAYKHFPRGSEGMLNRARLVQNYSAVTGACMLVSKTKFNQVDGFDEENLAITFNDVDFCLRLRSVGYRNLWTPFSELYHHESASREDDLSPDHIERFKQEIQYMEKKWGDILFKDPAYNLNLTLKKDDFSLAEKTRKGEHFE
jgi:glycosyltransferase involved in cell wall biosynthesis